MRLASRAADSAGTACSRARYCFLTDLYVPEEQFLAFLAQVVEIADVVAIAVDVVEDDATRRRPLDVLAQVPCRKQAHSPVGLHRPIYGSESFLRGDDV